MTGPGAGRPPRAAWILAATILGSGMVFLDGTVVNVALPALQADLDATVAGVQWVVEAYALLLASLLLVGGALGDRFGRRRVFALGVASFGAASVACGCARSLETLIAARAAQGAAGALLVPGSLAILRASFPGPERGRAIGAWSGFSAVSAGLGLVLGGWLLDVLAWPWIFFVNVPVAAATLAIAAWAVPESRARDGGALDAPGALLATLGLGGVTFGLVEASERGWTSPVVLAALAAGLALSAAFLARERACPRPMLPLSLFRRRAFAGANLLTLLLYAALSGATFLLPLNLIQVQGYRALQAGAATLPFVLVMSLLSRWAGGLYDRVGPRPPLVAGPLVAAAGLVLLARPGLGEGYWTAFFPGVLVLGIGMAIAVAPLSTTVMDAVEEGRAGLASGVNNAVSRTAAVLAIAAVGPLAVASFQRSLAPRLGALGLAAGARAAVLAESVDLGAARVPPAVPEAARERVALALDLAFVDAYRAAVLGFAVLAALASAAALWIDDPRSARR